MEKIVSNTCLFFQLQLFSNLAKCLCKLVHFGKIPECIVIHS